MNLKKMFNDTLKFFKDTVAEAVDETFNPNNPNHPDHPDNNPTDGKSFIDRADELEEGRNRNNMKIDDTAPPKPAKPSFNQNSFKKTPKPS